MKKTILFTGFSLLPVFAVAEAIEIDKEDLIIEEVQGNLSRSNSEPRVVILNNQNQKVDQSTAQGLENDEKLYVSSQPVVRVMGTPISMSHASELKKSRQEAEIKTEQSLVEKLESSRLKDEQERLKKIFGEYKQKTVVTAQTVPVEQGQPVDNSEIYTEIVSPVEHNEGDRIYIGVQGGQSSNLTPLENVTSHDGSFGITVGAVDGDSGLILESNFFYSKHTIDPVAITTDTYGYYRQYRNNENSYDYAENSLYVQDAHQLTASLSLKYTPFVNRFRPYVGANISYGHWIHRNNQNTIQYCDYTYSINSCATQKKTDSIDLGANAGVDFQLSKKVSVGFNLFVNIMNVYNNNTSDTGYAYDENTGNKINVIDLEETNWLIASINAKLYF